MFNATTCPIGWLATAQAINVTDLNIDITTYEASLRAQLASSIAIATLLLVGSMVLVLAGARLVKPTLFLAAFGATLYASVLACVAVLNATPAVSDDVSCVLLGAVPVALAAVGGFAAICALNLGFFLLGGATGAALGQLLYATCLYQLPTVLVFGSTSLVYLLTLSLSGLIGAILLLKFEKRLLMVATAALGAPAATYAIALLLAHANVRFLLDAGAPGSPYIWAPAACALGLFALGLGVQCRLGKRAEEKKALRSSQVPLMQP